ncbi:terminase gpA endonuclease subunit [Xenorhabdus budapestensis]|uniref:terminase gpA endonuclease subunit n=1 Tax=Xenorhabdus budapestensis TaxID=290110 RepID=UPI003A8BB947
MHFPIDRDLHYFSQLLAERSVIKDSGGQRYRVWEQIPGRANEALDCRVYSYAALCGLMYMGLKLNLLADNIVGNPDRLIAPPAQSEIKTNLRFPGAIIPESTEDKPKRKHISQLLP